MRVGTDHRAQPPRRCQPPLGGLARNGQRGQVGGRAAGDEAAAGAGRQPGPIGDEPQHLVLRVDRAGRLQPGDALDRRAGDQHVEQQRRLSRRGRDEAEEAGTVSGDDGWRERRGVHAQHLVRVMAVVAEQPGQRDVQFGRVAGALVERHRVKPQPVFGVGEHGPDHLLCRGVHAMHGRQASAGSRPAGTPCSLLPVRPGFLGRVLGLADPPGEHRQPVPRALPSGCVRSERDDGVGMPEPQGDLAVPARQAGRRRDSERR